MANLNSGDTQVSQVALNTVGIEAAQVYDFSGMSPRDILIANSDNPTGRKWTTISVDPLTAGTITTTAPAFQLEGSEDNSVWYSIGSPLTAVASSSVELTVSSKSATYTRVRVSTAGSGATIGYVSLKAWS